jgi:hypothetical protein
MTEGKKECEITIISMNLIADQIINVATNLDIASVTSLINRIMSAKKVFLIGTGI